ncbi:hypothetical protein DCAR_0417264 [Daucus carota subsp. sativus]|uniref:Cysteine-rich transmembrane domain-containing protein n=1 Tax=Daucus carota subsp. sativus TaxID=79200 RepID=A0AAF0X0D5_DAUCS|nr:PREDICTED: cysteine-rich and transmembrane domain-containing protein A [Daucus carota subsp. sativus]WOG97923.1 hypothetical protein DCAR_0417264 [Daucus carota subsp. sativus]
MNHFNEHEIPVADPLPLSIDEKHTPAMAPPPPAGYPTKDHQDDAKLQVPRATETQSRGDDFWKGCAAALCCCCVLDCCF